MRWLAAPLALLAALVPWTQMRIDERLGQFRAQDESLYLWSGRHVKRLSPGFEGLMADIYWLRTVQYFGGQRAFAREKRFELLYPLIEITTTLDPRLEIAYRYGAIFLSEPPPIGAGRPRDGIAILERGTKALPQAWRLRQDLGFFHFLFLDDAHRAAEILFEAAEIPGAAYWLKTLAADILAKGGEREASRRMWQQLYEQSEEGVIKQNARERLRILDALDQADALTAKAAEFERRVGRRPRSLSELTAIGVAGRLLADSSGAPFAYDPETGRVRISQNSVLWRPGFTERSP